MLAIFTRFLNENSSVKFNLMKVNLKIYIIFQKIDILFRYYEKKKHLKFDWDNTLKHYNIYALT